MTTALLSFALFSLLLTVAPGPGTLLVLRSCVREGSRTGAATAAGAAADALVWSAAYDAVRLAGTAYLVLLGIQALRARHRTDALPDLAPAAAPAAASRLTAFRQGLLSDLLNPKVGLFFIAAVPSSSPTATRPWASLSCPASSTPPSCSPGSP